MRWAGLSLVLFLLLQSVFLSGQSNEKADITKAELMTILNEREFLISELKDFKENYSLLDLRYQALDQKYQDLENESHRQKIESNLRIASLNELKRTTIWDNVKWFIAGLGVGFAGGEAVGIRIGVTL